MAGEEGGGGTGASSGGIIMGLGEAGFSALAAHKSWKRQKAIMKNAIQWRVADMKAAGINPILAVSPGGGGGGGGAPQAAPINLSRGFESAKGLSKLPRELRLLRAQVQIAENQVEQSFHAASREGILTVYDEYRTLREKEGLEFDRLRKPAARAQGRMDRTQFGEKMRQLNRVIRSVTGRDPTTAR